VLEPLQLAKLHGEGLAWFADKVGDVPVMGSAKDAERQPFKFYV
jgi:hypothetical protein